MTTDFGKLAKAIINTGDGSAAYVLASRFFPGDGQSVIAILTASGAGAEMTAISVF